MTRKGALPARTAAPPRSAALYLLALLILLSTASCSPPPGPRRDSAPAESWEVLLTTPVRVLLNRHPERGFAAKDFAQAFLGPGAKLTAVLHFEAGEYLPSGCLELFDDRITDRQGLLQQVGQVADPLRPQPSFWNRREVAILTPGFIWACAARSTPLGGLSKVKRQTSHL